VIPANRKETSSIEGKKRGGGGGKKRPKCTVWLMPACHLKKERGRERRGRKGRGKEVSFP